MSKGTPALESEVGELHRLLTQTHLRITRRVLTLLESADEAEVELGLSLCSPALLTAIANFIKQNNVTCQPESIEDLNSTMAALQNKRKRGSQLVNIPFEDVQQ